MDIILSKASRARLPVNRQPPHLLMTELQRARHARYNPRSAQSVTVPLAMCLNRRAISIRQEPSRLVYSPLSGNATSSLALCGASYPVLGDGLPYMVDDEPL
jgi:hypothetical protein